MVDETYSIFRTTQEEPATKKSKESEAKPAPSRKYMNAKELLNLVETFGTKMANMIFYLRRL